MLRAIPSAQRLWLTKICRCTQSLETLSSPPPPQSQSPEQGHSWAQQEPLRNLLARLGGAYGASPPGAPSPAVWGRAQSKQHCPVLAVASAPGTQACLDSCRVCPSVWEMLADRGGGRAVNPLLPAGEPWVHHLLLLGLPEGSLPPSSPLPHPDKWDTVGFEGLYILFPAPAGNSGQKVSSKG